MKYIMVILLMSSTITSTMRKQELEKSAAQKRESYASFVSVMKYLEKKERVEEIKRNVPVPEDVMRLILYMDGQPAMLVDIQ